MIVFLLYMAPSAYAGLEHRAAFPPRAGAAAGMRVTEVRKAGWHIRRRPKINSYDAGGQECSIKGKTASVGIKDEGKVEVL